MLQNDLRSSDHDLIQRQVVLRLKAYQVAFEACDFVSRFYASLSRVIGKVGADAIYLYSLEQLSRRFVWLHHASVHPPSLDHFDALYNSLSVQSGDQANKAAKALRIQLAQCVKSLLGISLAQHLVDGLTKKSAIEAVDETIPTGAYQYDGL